MSLERKDVRFKLVPELHAALTVLAEIAQVELGEFVELIVQREVLRRVHDAKVVADRTACLGLTGSGRESRGTSGSVRE